MASGDDEPFVVRIGRAEEQRKKNYPSGGVAGEKGAYPLTGAVKRKLRDTRTKGHEEFNNGNRMGLKSRRVIRPTAQRGHGVAGWEG